MTFNFHILGFPHTAVNKDYNACAYTQKMVKYIQMMAPRGHQITLYANEGSVVPKGVELVQIFTQSEMDGYFGPHDKQQIYGIEWEPDKDYWVSFSSKCATETSKRVKRGDFILYLGGGHCYKPVSDRFPKCLELGSEVAAMVDYGSGHYFKTSDYVVYESHGHREANHGWVHSKWHSDLDAVIPNYFDIKDFRFGPNPEESDPRIKIIQKEPYFLFIGRLISEKGLDYAIKATGHLGVRLVMCGQGKFPDNLPDHVFPFGYADTEQRKSLIAGAVGLYAPTLYREPFGGVAVEALLSGTPAITTDHGAFCETVEPRFRGVTVSELVEAGQLALTLTVNERKILQAKAQYQYSLEAIAPQYERYFSRIYEINNMSKPCESKITQSQHDEAQDFEAGWWGNCGNTMGEETKQLLYFDRMGLPPFHNTMWNFNFHGEGLSILDIGGGPVSALLKFQGATRRTIVDPCNYPKWVDERYAACGIEQIKSLAEDISFNSCFDLVLIYNCLQHVHDPEKIVSNALRALKPGGKLHMFEWVDRPVEPGHPHVLTQDNLEKWTGLKGKVEMMNQNECYGKAWYV